MYENLFIIFYNIKRLFKVNFGKGYFSVPKNSRNLNFQTKNDKVHFDLNDSVSKNSSNTPGSIYLDASRSPSSISLTSSTNSLSRL